MGGQSLRKVLLLIYLSCDEIETVEGIRLRKKRHFPFFNQEKTFSLRLVCPACLPACLPT